MTFSKQKSIFKNAHRFTAGTGFAYPFCHNSKKLAFYERSRYKEK